jgi:predicted GNAT family N-acyltransferase
VTDHVKTYPIEPLAKHHDRARFDCGTGKLNDYLRKYARQNDDKNISRTFVAVDSKNTIKGYYSISTSEVEFAELPDEIGKRLPKYPVPAARIGRLAIDKTAQGTGLGKRLLIDALVRIAGISGQIGVKVVVVDAKDDKAKEFYQYYGFQEVRDNPLKLFLPIETAFQIIPV